MPAAFKDRKLTADMVREIRSRIDPIRSERMRLDQEERRALAEIADAMRVHVRTIRKVANRERWKGVK